MPRRYLAPLISAQGLTNGHGTSQPNFLSATNGFDWRSSPIVEYVQRQITYRYRVPLIQPQVGCKRRGGGETKHLTLLHQSVQPELIAVWRHTCKP